MLNVLFLIGSVAQKYQLKMKKPVQHLYNSIIQISNRLCSCNFLLIIDFSSAHCKKSSSDSQEFS